MLNFEDVKVDEFEQLPDGVYSVMIAAASYHQTKSGGKAVVVRYQVTDNCPSNKAGMTHAEYYNVEHTNPKAVEIGMQNLKKLITVLGLPMKLSQPDELEGRYCLIVLKTKTDKNGNERQNIARYLAPQSVAQQTSTVSNDQIPF